jgi:hypothetical protein
MTVVATLLLLVAWWFAALRVIVNDGGVTARYGPFHTHLPRDAITTVEVERYPWLVYAGWGIRYGTRGRRAWSVPFMSAGVAMTTTAGKRYHVSSRDPERLRSAVADSLAGRGNG